MIDCLVCSLLRPWEPSQFCHFFFQSHKVLPLRRECFIGLCQLDYLQVHCLKLIVMLCHFCFKQVLIVKSWCLDCLLVFHFQFLKTLGPILYGCRLSSNLSLQLWIYPCQLFIVCLQKLTVPDNILIESQNLFTLLFSHHIFTHCLFLIDFIECKT